MKKFVYLTCFYCFLLSIVVFVHAEPIDREAVIKRHRVFTTGTLSMSPAQVGNGKFAFGMDVTGLQTFAPFNTLSDWAWHSFPLPEGMNLEDYKPQIVETYGKKVAYFNTDPEHPEVSEYLARNPHRFNLGRIAFRLLRDDGKEAREIDLRAVRQEMDLWSGIVYSRFELNKKEVRVSTVCHPEKDMIGVTVESGQLKEGKIAVYLDFSYPETRQFPHFMGRYDTVSAHQSTLEKIAANTVCISRVVDNTHYFVTLSWEGQADLIREENTHRFILQPKDGETLSFTCCYSPEKQQENMESVASIKKKSAVNWEKYWRSGAAIDLSGSKDPRWLELERRIVLSQYIMRVNEAGLFPPQESGLVNNGWYGRFHFEMIWWHGVHYGLWNRMEYFNNYLNIYKDFMPMYEEIFNQTFIQQQVQQKNIQQNRNILNSAQKLEDLLRSLDKIEPEYRNSTCQTL